MVETTMDTRGSVAKRSRRAADMFDAAVQQLHRAALADVSWDSAAALINELVRTRGHSLTYVRPDAGGGLPEILMSRFFIGRERRADVEQLYFRDYFARDEAVPRLYGIRDRELVYKADLYTPGEKRKSAAYNRFRRVYKTENGLFMGIDGLEGCGMIMSFANSTAGEGWGHDQIRIIGRLAPHVRQFARVRRALADARAQCASLGGLFDNKRLGLIQVDRAGRVIEATDRARDILLEQDGLHDRGGELAAGHKGENSELRRLLARASPSDGTTGVGGALKITRGDHRTPLVLEIHPGAQPDDSWRLGALVLIVDPASRPRVDPALLTRFLGLTPRESVVAAAVASGRTVAGTANELGCAENTVRTHLKQVYRKLGICKQTELVRAVLSLKPLG